MIIVSSGLGTVTNINTTAPLSGGPITTSGTITTAMATNKLIGRSTSGTGVMEEITVGSGLTLTSGTLSSSGGATAAGNTNEIQFNNGGAFAASSNFDWIIADNRLLLGTENTADINSRMVVIGKGVSTNNTFVIHNSTGTNNALIVKDNGNVGIGTSSPSQLLTVNGSILTSAGTSVYVGGTTVLGVNGLRLHNNGGSSFLDNKGTGSFFFRSDNTDGSSTRMVLTPSGNLLLGTSTDIATSILTLNSTTKGLLLTRLTTAEKTTLATAAPTAGTLIYDTTLNKLCIYTGAAFETVTST